MSDIWIKQLDRGPLSRLTFEEFLKYRPTWSPDGRSVTYIVDPGNNNASLYRKRADGSGAAERLLGVRQVAGGGALVARRPVAGGAHHTADPRHPGLPARRGYQRSRPSWPSPKFDERAATLSPDGRWIAYQSDETGKVRDLRAALPRRPTKGAGRSRPAGGDEPLWSRGWAGDLLSGRVGRDDGGAVTTTPAFAAEAPRALFPAKAYARAASYRAYDVTPDDRRFVMLRPVADSVAAAPNQLVVVDNWFDELKAKLRSK